MMFLRVRKHTSPPQTQDTMGTLSNDDGNGNGNGNGNENRTWKFIYNFNLFVLLREYFNPSNLHKNSELPRNQLGRRGVRVEKDN